MRRRSLLACGLGPWLAAAPARAQRTPRIGVLRWGTAGDGLQANLGGALAALGYVEGRSIEITWRFATDAATADRHAAELGGLGLDLVVASATPAAQALQRAGFTRPVVMGTAADPVGAGLVASLARPGGNVTGVSSNLTGVVGKQLQLLAQAVPGLRRAAFLGSSADVATPIFVARLREAASALGLALTVVQVPGVAEMAPALAELARGGVQGVVVQPLFVLGQSGSVASMLAAQRLPAVSGLVQFPRAGGLMSYGPNRAESWRRTASFVDRILRGADPSTLPVEEPTTFELVVNRRTANALGLALPRELLLRADEVIE